MLQMFLCTKRFFGDSDCIAPFKLLKNSKTYFKNRRKILVEARFILSLENNSKTRGVLK